MICNRPSTLAIVGTSLIMNLAIPSKVYSEETPDAVTGMCLDAGQSLEVCSCASDVLLNELGDENFASYERVGKAYLKELADGAGRSDAWMTALDAEGAKLASTNEYGNNHRAAMNACGS